MGRDIKLNEEHDIKVYQPLIEDVVDIGEDEFQQVIMPFILTTEAVFNGAENEDELNELYDMFDLFFLKGENGKTLLDDAVFDGKSATDVLADSVKYFTRADDVRILEMRQKIVVNNNYLIDKEEFTRIRKVIQAVLGRSDIEVEKPPKDMSERQKQIWFKLQKGRRRRAEKEAVYLQDLINYTSFGGTSYISLKEIDKMTYFQLHNAYKSIVGVDAYRTGLQYKVSQKYEIKDEIKHWSESIKIGK